MMAHRAAHPAAATDTPSPATDATHFPTTAAPAANPGSGPPAKPLLPPSSPTTTENRVPDTYARLASSFSSFLAVSMHQILFLRSVYPPATFLPVRQYNHPVKQSRHPGVCSWINDACSFVEAALIKSSISAASFVIVSERTNRPLERYTFDFSQIPQVESTDIHTLFASAVAAKTGNIEKFDIFQKSANAAQSIPKSVPSTATVDTEAQFRGVLARLASACARLTPLPQHEEYRPALFVILRPNAEPPAGITAEEQWWIPTEPNGLSTVPTESVNGDFPERKSFGNSNSKGLNENNKRPCPNSPKTPSNGTPNNCKRSRAQTVPVRRVDAGEMQLEVWAEEAYGKFEILDRLNTG
ncbi:HORMA domain containing protein [Coccidioides posadasii C735 delta SOWgp]|uniref:HORMA domain containing protein n=1 Tax=Coccidioides posadasii (strain C735) TaxID=222929 RepID=C5PEJ5_COCP7|nr:HORMA domain containing protein [Coccidioides posadasii C735 delta SOWgp]EER24515.1 HORMA domain containing protein [Coccidioides posadasii C735 delta SOWgp]|eukprot:XP_003066660.1 HORMA domain containing protein [Coccidioides posadasii C735 delta SOWgp]